MALGPVATPQFHTPHVPAEAMEKDAVFDASGRYRYSLSRHWGPGSAKATFILLNPSTADEFRDDPTIRRCIGFARSWGFDRLEVVNLFAFRATHPRDLRRAGHPVGADNDGHLLRAFLDCQLAVLAWGRQGSLWGRDAEVLERLRGRGPGLHCLGRTKDGHPRHVLYLPRGLQPLPFIPDARRA